jgi:hypothetical protein
MEGDFEGAACPPVGDVQARTIPRIQKRGYSLKKERLFIIGMPCVIEKIKRKNYRLKKSSFLVYLALNTRF